MPTVSLSQKKTKTSLRPALFSALFPAAAGFLLAGVPVGTLRIPAALCLPALTGAGVSGAAAVCGAVLGALALADGDLLLTLLAGGTVALAAAALFSRETAASPVRTALVTLLATVPVCGAVCLSEGASGLALTRLLLTVLLTAACAYALRRFPKSRERGWRLGLVAVFAAGAAVYRLPGGIPLGGILAAALCVARLSDPDALMLAFSSGIGLDLALGGGAFSAALMLAVCAARTLPRKWHWRRGALFFVGFCLPLGIFGADGGAMASLALGTAAGLFLPKSVAAAPLREPTAADLASETLHAVALACDEPHTAPEVCYAEVFDRAAAAVCTHCSRVADCWTEHSAETCRIFSAAGKKLLRRGAAEPSDFPAAFRTQCRCFPGLTSAINDAVSDLAAERRRTNYRTELRTVLSDCCRILASYLRPGTQSTSFVPLFRAEAAWRTVARDGVRSGDRAESFTVGARHFVLLCDGVGTGTEAQQQSRETVTFLLRLLQGGVAGEDALALLNAIAVLREGGCAAVDLVCADLVSGEATLLKWGGAPSYLKGKDALKKIGTASLPPGVGVDKTHGPQRIRLSLRRGEALILTSDGLGGEDAERRLNRSGQVGAAELADLLTEPGSAPREDDATAAVLILRPVVTHRNDTTCRAKILSK